MAAKIIGSRSGIRINVASIAKDSEGYDDLDDFWNASGKYTTIMGVQNPSCDGETIFI